ncbi:MAG: flavodoxin domain-containing protein [Candidatus Celaenobacter polaris]|nr:flavodoxin domain-containing protein [Candidatus Celaenobacter polaris]
MKNCILFITKHGSTEKAALLLKEKLKADTDIINLKDVKKPNISDYDTVILGASIYIGKIQKLMRKFIKENLNELFKKNIALFIMAGQKERAQETLKNAFPATLFDHAFAKEHFGYEMILEKMNFLEKAATRAQGVTESKSEIMHDAIEKMAYRTNEL